MKSKILLAFVAGLTVFGCGHSLQEEEAASPEDPSSCKPIPPFTLTANLSADGSMLAVRCRPGIAGTLTLRTTLSADTTRETMKGELVEHHLAVAGEESIRVTAILTSGNARFVRTITAGNPPPPAASRAIPRKNSRGESILEFRAR